MAVESKSTVLDLVLLFCAPSLLVLFEENHFLLHFSSSGNPHVTSVRDEWAPGGAAGAQRMTTIMEQTRQLHADIERCERGVIKSLQEREGLTRHKEQLWNEHRISHLCNTVGSHSSALRDLYEDADASRRNEMQSLSGGGRTESQFAAFYDRLRDIKDYYRRFPPAELLSPVDQEGGDAELYPKPAEPHWSGEEAWGRFLDLHTYHEMWLNMPGNNQEGDDPMTYSEYVESFSNLGEVPINKKRAWGPRYTAYTEALRDYLSSFAKRAQPLVEFDEFMAGGAMAFEAAWTAGSLPGWGRSVGVEDEEDEGINLLPFDTAEALAGAVDMDDLKEELSRLGLKVCISFLSVVLSTLSHVGGG